MCLPATWGLRAVISTPLITSKSKNLSENSKFIAILFKDAARKAFVVGGNWPEILNILRQKD